MFNWPDTPPSPTPFSPNTHTEIRKGKDQIALRDVIRAGDSEETSWHSLAIYYAVSAMLNILHAMSYNPPNNCTVAIILSYRSHS